MTNGKSLKRALLTSAFSLIICVAMLIGTTFAWFTDTASTAVNKIQAGNLKVDIVDKNGNSLNGKSLSFRDVNNKTDILWETHRLTKRFFGSRAVHTSCRSSALSTRAIWRSSTPLKSPVLTAMPN